MTLTAAGNFVVSPDPALLAWSVLAGLMLVAAAVTAAKGRVGWLALGFLTGGFLWLVTAFFAARPESLWARVFYGDEKMRRARSRFEVPAGS